jgi:protein tyrosine/serine phosphatase
MPLETMNPRARWALFAVIALGVLVLAAYPFKKHRYQFLTRNFGVVEEGKIFRSGYLEPWPLERMVRKHDLETVVTLTSDNGPNDLREGETLERLGVDLVRYSMPGSGCADFDLLEEAAGIVAETTRHPLLVHCSAGSNRTGAVVAVWRVVHEGWSLEQAFEEIAQFHQPPRVEEDLRAHLETWYTAYTARQSEGQSPQREIPVFE